MPICKEKRIISFRSYKYCTLIKEYMNYHGHSPTSFLARGDYVVAVPFSPIPSSKNNKVGLEILVRNAILQPTMKFKFTNISHM